ADPSGTPREWKATAIGGKRGEIQEFLEDHWSEELTLEDGLSLALEALLTVDDEIGAEGLSAATIGVESGYHTLSNDEIADRVEGLDLEDGDGDIQIDDDEE
ncbi:MAG: proteasome subunit alpha, partial [Halobaculum sp.]